MADCLNCGLATWLKTASGRLHPSGDGRCGWRWEKPKLPASFYWVGGGGMSPCGGQLDRHNLPKGDCSFFRPISEPPTLSEQGKGGGG